MGESPGTGLARASLYSPLDSAADEIRLLTLEPCYPGQLLRCHLGTFSLKQLRSEYVSFVSSNGLNSRTPRQIKQKWARPGSEFNFETNRDADDFHDTVPLPSLHRFQWGDFAALSYVWGEATNQRPIIINGIQANITPNLESALRTLAEDAAFTPRSQYRLWADAICINQLDDHERLDQVKKMREIYSGAWTVITWLGTAPPASIMNLAFPFIRLLASLEGDDRNLRKLMMPPGRPNLGTHIIALWRLMMDEYWFRLWIIQEVIMGAYSTVLRLGDHKLGMKIFLQGINVLYYGSNWLFKDEELERAGTSWGIRPNQLTWHTYGIHLIHTDLRQLTKAEEDPDNDGVKKLGFRRLLDMANTSECRDMKDKVFALVGMMEPAVAQDVMAAYEFEPARLFAAVAEAFIVHDRSLEPLRQGNPWGPAQGPSWAADWTWPGRIRFSRPEYNIVGPLVLDPSTPEVEPDGIYNAHGGLEAQFQFPDEDWGLLRCEGFVFDEVGGMGAPEAGFFDWDANRIVQCSEWRSAYGGLEETSRALCRALLLDVIIRGRRAEPRHIALLNLPIYFYDDALAQFKDLGWEWMTRQAGYYFKWECWRAANENFRLNDRTLGSFFTDRIPQDADEKTYIEVYCSVQRTVQQRRFMLTKKGYCW